MEYQALLFGPGQAAAGTPVAVCFETLQLSWPAPNGRHARAYAALTVARAGHNENYLGFSWNENGEAWSLVVADAAACKRLLAAPPSGLTPALAGLRQQTRRAGRRRALGWSAVALSIGIPLLLLLALLFAAQPLMARAAGLISIEQEQKLGAMLFKAQQARLDLIDNTPANGAVEEIGRRLTSGSRHTYRWHVAKDPSINAFAMPGGYIVVHTGLIDAADSPEELAGVIAHEVQHIEQRHSLQQIARELGLSAAISVVLGDAGTIGSMATQLAGLRFSRDHEREADLRGLESLLAADIDPTGMASMFRKLEAAAAGVSPPAFLSSHPATAERIATIEATIEAAAVRRPHQPIAVDWQAVQRSLADL